MRGTPHLTQRALRTPVLMFGAERSLVIMASLFWGWAFMGVFPHWPMLFVMGCYLATVYLLRFAAHLDPQGVALFKRNSRFLLQHRRYVARGYSNTVTTMPVVTSVPVSSLQRI